MGKEIDFENYRFRIDSIRERRIEQITMNIMTPDSGNGDEKDDDRSEEKGD